MYIPKEVGRARLELASYRLACLSKAGTARPTAGSGDQLPRPELTVCGTKGLMTCRLRHTKTPRTRLPRKAGAEFCVAPEFGAGLRQSGSSDLRLFGDRQGVVNLDTEIADCAFELRMAE